jgi:uncharacterized protein YkwD
MRDLPPRRVLVLALAATVALTVASPAVAPRSAQAASASVSGAAGAEIMRLTNLDRAAEGLAALSADPTLVALATDRPFRCPSGLEPAGRSLDMALRGYVDHVIPGCSVPGAAGTTLIALMPGLGYDTPRGENIAWNSGYGTGPATYAPGCGPDGAGCRGVPTSSIADVAAAERAFMSSSVHRANILGAYDRFGCGVARTGAGALYVTCLFSQGGPAPATAATVVAAPAGPVFARVLYTPSTVARLHSHEFAVVVRSPTGLRSLTMTLDGHVLGRWTLTGHSTGRYEIVPARLLPAGSHTIVWTLTDVAGHRTVLVRRVTAR